MQGGPTYTGPDARDSTCLTYEPFFRFREKPFSLSPNPRFFYRNRVLTAAFDALAAGIRRREGILALTGEVGTGKTTLCRAVLESLDRKTFAAFVPDPFLSREDLLKTLLVEFGVVSPDEIRNHRLRGTSRTELSYVLCDFLKSLQPIRAFAVVVIDEAQCLPSTLLEEIRILADMECEEKLLQLVLVGQPEFAARLATSEMRQLEQRLSVRVELEPLDRDDIGRYIAHRLAVAGNSRVFFDDEAVVHVWERSAGLPRVINLLCDKALAHAAAIRVGAIHAAQVTAAADDLRLAPKDSALLERKIDRSSDQPAEPPAPNRYPRASRQGLPSTYRMRHDAHYVDELESRVAAPMTETMIEERGASAAPIGRSETRRWTRGTVTLTCGTLVAAVLGLWGYRVVIAPWPFEVSDAVAQDLQPSGQPASDGSDGRADAPERTAETLAAPVDPDSSKTRDGFAIQMATFQGAARAAQSVQQLEAAGHTAFDLEVSLRGGARAFAVFLGPYTDRATAVREYERALQIPGYSAGQILEIGVP